MLNIFCKITEFDDPPSQNCGPNEVFHTCGSACPKTCSNQRKLRACPAVSLIVLL